MAKKAIDKESARARKGQQNRRRVLGDAYVDASLAGLDDFNREFYTLIHEWVWNDIWGRPGLPLKTRSLINMALLTALNRPRELRIHLKGALNNGCSADEIKEALMHTALYAGVPAVLDSMHLVREELIKSGHLPSAKKKSKR
ncbi:MAG: gamma carboxymuconolactone decarboxylase [Rhodospirillaceae bacterium]|nr:gamma carboxymuconolactone decarboxylase [Rhodospirillaceae bacterium]